VAGYPAGVVDYSSQIFQRTGNNTVRTIFDIKLSDPQKAKFKDDISRRVDTRIALTLSQ
jgi:hypothetical protein